MRTQVGSIAKVSGDLSTARALILVLAIVLLMGVAAVASREPLRAPGANPRPVSVSGGASGSAEPSTLVLVAAGALIAAGGLSLRRIGDPVHTTPAIKTTRLIWMPMLVVIGLLLASGGLIGSHRQVLPTPVLGVPKHLPRAVGRTTSHFALPTWVPVSILAVLLGGALAAWLLLRRARPSDLPAFSSLGAGVGAAIALSLEDLESDPDARRAVIAAYRRMEQSLAEAGLPRMASEAPREYLSRTLGALELDPNLLGTLTTLFERARFSLRQIDASVRDQAVTALRALQQELA